MLNLGFPYFLHVRILCQQRARMPFYSKRRKFWNSGILEHRLIREARDETEESLSDGSSTEEMSRDDLQEMDDVARGCAARHRRCTHRETPKQSGLSVAQEA